MHCCNFNIRFYPQCHEARARVQAGEVGDVWNVHGSYLQDWLLLPTDWNWRLDPAEGGELRAVGDIGSHWLDLVQFVTGRKIEVLLADLHTAIPVRQKPTGPVETFAQADDVVREPAEMTTDDLAHILLRFEGGARGSVVISQVSAGRRNHVAFEVDGSEGALYWSSERNEQLWLGHRGRPNELLWRDHAGSRLEAQSDAPPGAGPGRRYLEAGRRREARLRERRARARQLADRLVAKLAEEPRLVWHEICTAEGVAVSLAVLVPSDRALERRSELEGLVSSFDDVVGVVNGPWPPYSFADPAQ